VVATIVLVALVLAGLVTAEEAFSGFASPAVSTVWAGAAPRGGSRRAVWSRDRIAQGSGATA
jgi:di/tricarboxylate transporter